MTKVQKIQAVKDPEVEVPVKIMEKAIVDIANGFRQLTASRLNTRAIVLLVHDATKSHVNMTQVEAVLKAASALDKHFLR